LFIDNFDSFTFNLVDELEKRGAAVAVWRNDLEVERAMDIALALAPPRLIVLSPGPGAPHQAGVTMPIVRAAMGQVPLFGVCLGHQAIVEALGGEVGFAGEVVHGKPAAIHHQGSALLGRLPSPFMAARYHSLAALRVPDELEVTARAGHLVMAVEHRDVPLAGVQFHPESILTPHGGAIIEALMEWATRWHDGQSVRRSAGGDDG
jgi:anthranilate synthase component 2